MDFIHKHFSLAILIKVGITVVICLLAILILKRIFKFYFEKRVSRQSQVIISKIISIVGFTILGIVITDQLGFSSLFTTILGTAGVVGVAIGFASKASLENIISGFLLLSDKSFKIDDIVGVDGVYGTVVSIDSLSVKIRTFDNQIVRIPNVKFLNSNVTNLYPDKERRKDFYFKVSYKSDLAKIDKILKEIAHRNPYAIRKSDTYVFFSSFEDIGYKIKYGVWFKKGDITEVTNSITKDISETFKKEGIEIPSLLLKTSDN